MKKAYAALVKQGWTDALRTLHPVDRIYTFWDYFRNAYVRDAGLRIDHLLLTPVLAKRLTRAEVDKPVRGWEKSSDQSPDWIELTDSPGWARRKAKFNARNTVAKSEAGR